MQTYFMWVKLIFACSYIWYTILICTIGLIVYLEEVNCKKTYNVFLEECESLNELREIIDRKSQTMKTVHNRKLIDFLFFEETKSCDFLIQIFKSNTSLISTIVLFRFLKLMWMNLDKAKCFLLSTCWFKRGLAVDKIL